MKIVLVILALGLTTGCANLSSSPKYRDVQLQRSGNQALVTIFRTEENLLYFLRSAPVYLNGGNEVSLPTGSFHSYALDPGRYRFLTRTFDAKSECVLDVTLKENTDYYLQVVPNTDAMQKLMADAFIWMAEAAITERITTLSVGEYNQLCEGMFAFLPTTPMVALRKLPELRRVNQDAGFFQ